MTTEQQIDEVVNKIHMQEFDAESLPRNLEIAKAKLLQIVREARISSLHSVQIYTDPSHQKASPFTRLKEADLFINKELARLEKE